MKMVLASKNQMKLTELQAILQQLGVQCMLEQDAGVDLEVEETGTTFEENALLKARAVMQATGLPGGGRTGRCARRLFGALWRRGVPVGCRPQPAAASEDGTGAGHGADSAVCLRHHLLYAGRNGFDGPRQL